MLKLRSVTLSLLLATPPMLLACDEQPSAPPDTTTADTADPDTADPDTADPDTAAPDTQVEDTSAPDTQVADTQVADTQVADTSAPEDTGAPDVADSAQPDTADAGIVLPTERPPIVTTVSTGLGGWTMEPGQEATKCVVKRLSNTEALWVSQVRTRLSQGSHHLIVYKSDETEEQATPFNCTPFVETLKGQTFPLMITQIREETLSFPNGVAFRFEPNQMVRIEAHYLNYYPNPITTDAEIHFDGIAASDVVSEANMLFYGNPDIQLPANQTTTSPTRFLSVLPGTHVFAMTGHTHAYGTHVSIATAQSLADEGTTVYPPEGKRFVWDEPPLAYFDPPLTFEGGGGFNYNCSWNNTSSRAVGFGESANQEMCFFWAYYYPSNGYRLCVSPGTIGDGIAGDEVCCPGHWVCDYITQFL